MAFLLGQDPERVLQWDERMVATGWDYIDDMKAASNDRHQGGGR